MKGTIWLVEDDEHLNIINGRKLRKQGYQVLTAETLAEARALLEGPLPDLILLDIMLPDGSGLDFCDDVRERGDIPVLFLTARDESEDIVQGLARGGDDYLTKPYDLEVLSARVEAVLRRSRKTSPILRVGGLELNTASGRATLDGEDLLLTPREFALLEYLARRQGAFFSADELYKSLWELDTLRDMRTVWEHISRIRKKVGTESGVAIESVRGKGYRLAALP